MAGDLARIFSRLPRWTWLTALVFAGVALLPRASWAHASTTKEAILVEGPASTEGSLPLLLVRKKVGDRWETDRETAVRFAESLISEDALPLTHPVVHNDPALHAAWIRSAREWAENVPVSGGRERLERLWAEGHAIAGLAMFDRESLFPNMQSTYSRRATVAYKRALEDVQPASGAGFAHAARAVGVYMPILPPQEMDAQLDAVDAFHGTGALLDPNFELIDDGGYNTDRSRLNLGYDRRVREMIVRAMLRTGFWQRVPGKGFGATGKLVEPKPGAKGSPDGFTAHFTCFGFQNAVSLMGVKLRPHTTQYEGKLITIATEAGSKTAYMKAHVTVDPYANPEASLPDGVRFTEFHGADDTPMAFRGLGVSGAQYHTEKFYFADGTAPPPAYVDNRQKTFAEQRAKALATAEVRRPEVFHAASPVACPGGACRQPTGAVGGSGNGVQVARGTAAPFRAPSATIH